MAYIVLTKDAPAGSLLLLIEQDFIKSLIPGIIGLTYDRPGNFVCNKDISKIYCRNATGWELVKLSGGGGVAYLAGQGINISNNKISAAVDGTTISFNSAGQLVSAVSPDATTKNFTLANTTVVDAEKEGLKKAMTTGDSTEDTLVWTDGEITWDFGAHTNTLIWGYGNISCYSIEDYDPLDPLIDCNMSFNFAEEDGKVYTGMKWKVETTEEANVKIDTFTCTMIKSDGTTEVLLTHVITGYICHFEVLTNASNITATAANGKLHDPIHPLPHDKRLDCAFDDTGYVVVGNKRIQLRDISNLSIKDLEPENLFSFYDGQNTYIYDYFRKDFALIESNDLKTTKIEIPLMDELTVGQQVSCGLYNYHSDTKLTSILQYTPTANDHITYIKYVINYDKETKDFAAKCYMYDPKHTLIALTSTPVHIDGPCSIYMKLPGQIDVSKFIDPTLIKNVSARYTRWLAAASEADYDIVNYKNIFTSIKRDTYTEINSENTEYISTIMYGAGQSSSTEEVMTKPRNYYLSNGKFNISVDRTTGGAQAGLPYGSWSFAWVNKNNGIVVGKQYKETSEKYIKEVLYLREGIKGLNIVIKYSDNTYEEVHETKTPDRNNWAGIFVSYESETTTLIFPWNVIDYAGTYERSSNIDVATSTSYGQVKIDNSTIKMNEQGQIYIEGDDLHFTTDNIEYYIIAQAEQGYDTGMFWLTKGEKVKDTLRLDKGSFEFALGDHGADDAHIAIQLLSYDYTSGEVAANHDYGKYESELGYKVSNVRIVVDNDTSYIYLRNETTGAWTKVDEFDITDLIIHYQGFFRYCTNASVVSATGTITDPVYQLPHDSRLDEAFKIPGYAIVGNEKFELVDLAAHNAKAFDSDCIHKSYDGTYTYYYDFYRKGYSLMTDLTRTPVSITINVTPKRTIEESFKFGIYYCNNTGQEFVPIELGEYYEGLEGNSKIYSIDFKCEWVEDLSIGTNGFVPIFYARDINNKIVYQTTASTQGYQGPLGFYVSVVGEQESSIMFLYDDSDPIGIYYKFERDDKEDYTTPDINRDILFKNELNTKIIIHEGFNRGNNQFDTNHIFTTGYYTFDFGNLSHTKGTWTLLILDENDNEKAKEIFVETDTTMVDKIYLMRDITGYFIGCGGAGTHYYTDRNTIACFKITYEPSSGTCEATNIWDLFSTIDYEGIYEKINTIGMASAKEFGAVKIDDNTIKINSNGLIYAIGGGGGSYTAGNGIDISNNTIATKIDDNTLQFKDDGTLMAAYAQGRGIAINYNTIETVSYEETTAVIQRQVSEKENQVSWRLKPNQFIECGYDDDEYYDTLELNVTSTKEGPTATPLKFTFQEDDMGLSYYYTTSGFTLPFQKIAMIYKYDEEDDTSYIKISVTVEGGAVITEEKAVEISSGNNITLLSVTNDGPITIDTATSSSPVYEINYGLPTFSKEYGLARNEDNEISIKVDGTTVSFNNNGELVATGSSSNDTFIAIYDSTSIESITAAYNAGKTIFCKYTNDNTTCIMNLDYAGTNAEGSAYFEFSSVDTNKYLNCVSIDSLNNWGEVMHYQITGGIVRIKYENATHQNIVQAIKNGNSVIVYVGDPEDEEDGYAEFVLTYADPNYVELSYSGHTNETPDRAYISTLDITSSGEKDIKFTYLQTTTEEDRIAKLEDRVKELTALVEKLTTTEEPETEESKVKE